MSDSKRALPVLNGRLAASSLRTDGTRARVYPADVRGRFASLRRLAFFLLIGLWVVLPVIKIGGAPALFLDIETRRFFLFGATFNSQDIWLLFFIVTGVGFGLLYVTALLGRVFCGWACPQTVFLEGVFRPIERLVGGPREARMRRDAGPSTFGSVVRFAVTHILYIVAAVLVAHIFVSYFVSLPRLFQMLKQSPSAHPEAFAWMLGLTAAFYINFGFFREQMCIVLCPYGRLQSVLLDDDSLVVGYDEKRGEPRGKVGKTSGDCVDCHRCVVVCPTGIDIRNGLQLDCVACTACIDACDAVMTKLGRAKGLIRYDSLNGLWGNARRILRPRIFVYTGFLVAGIIAFSLAIRKHDAFEANLLRLPGIPYTRDGRIRNAFEVHLVNKAARPEVFELEAESQFGEEFILPMREVRLESLASQRIPVFVTIPTEAFRHDVPVAVRVWRKGSEKETKRMTATFLGARQ